MIETRNLTKRYGSKTAVDDLTMTVRPGIVTGFLGPNGAGKSTTMRMMLGLDTPTRGTATVAGRPYAELERPLTQVGGLLDAKWVHPGRSARDHLRWLAASNGIPRRRVEECLELVGLSAVAKQKVGGFSLGMHQRLGLATAMLGDPGCLVLDEPVNGLDPEGIHWMRGFLKNLAREGRTVLVSSHMLSEMALTAERLLVITQGRLASDSTVDEFVEEHVQSRVRVRARDLGSLRNALERAGISDQEVRQDDEGRTALYLSGVTSDEVGVVAAGAGAVLLELATERASLEDAFMTLTRDHVEYQAAAPHQEVSL